MNFDSIWNDGLVWLRVAFVDLRPPDGANIYKRATLFNEIIACLIIPPVFMAWHHGLIAAIVVMAMGWVVKTMFGWLLYLLFYVGLAVFHVKLYGIPYFTTNYETPDKQRLEAGIAFVMLVILTFM